MASILPLIEQNESDSEGDRLTGANVCQMTFQELLMETESGCNLGRFVLCTLRFIS